MNEAKQLNIKDAEAYDLATEIAAIRGGSRKDAVVTALRREADYARRMRDREARIAALLAYGDLYAAYPDSGLSEDEILDYDANGVPRNRA